MLSVHKGIVHIWIRCNSISTSRHSTTSQCV